MSPNESRRWKIGIVGCGNIFERYFTGIGRFPNLDIVGCADIDPGRSREASEEFGIPAFDVEGLLGSAQMDVVVNLTPPLAHGSVTCSALSAGKHVYVEKPLAATLAEADEVLATALAANRRVGCAPDTFLGSAGQTARASIDAGIVGEPIGVACFVTHTMGETFHPDPSPFFQPGGGPVLDMGPYSVANMVNCLGPIEEVFGATRIGAQKRFVTSPNRRVDVIDVKVATHASAVLRFTSGVLGTVIMSFDIWGQDLPYIEIYGTEGALRLADPNSFDGQVSFKPNGADTHWQVVESVLPCFGQPGTDDQMLRGIGVADLVKSLEGSTHRLNMAFAYHVLEVLCAIELSSQTRRPVELTSTVERPLPVTQEDWQALFS